MAWARHQQRVRSGRRHAAGCAGTRSRGGRDGGRRTRSGRARRSGAGARCGAGPDAVDQPSIVEALDDLPAPRLAQPRTGAWLSDAALERLVGLQQRVRRLRSLTGLPLADLVGEAERRPRTRHRGAVAARLHPGAPRGRTSTRSPTWPPASRPAPTAPTSAGSSLAGGGRSSEERGLDKGYIEASPDAVQILTVHAAKGLEWDAVAVPGLVEGSFPALNYSKATHNGTDWVRRRRQGPGLVRRACRACPTTCGATATASRCGSGAAPRTGPTSRPGPASSSGPAASTASSRSAGWPTWRSPGPAPTCSSAPRSGLAPARPGSPRGSSTRSPTGPGWPWNASAWADMPDPDVPESVKNPRDAEALSRRSGPGAAAHRATSRRAAEAVRMATDRQGQDGRVPTQAHAGRAPPAGRGAAPARGDGAAPRRARPPARAPTGGRRRPAAPVHLGRRVAGPGPGRLRLRAAPADAAGARAGGSARAPPSTPGSSSTTPRRRWSTSSTCRAAPTRTPATMPSCPR